MTKESMDILRWIILTCPECNEKTDAQEFHWQFYMGDGGELQAICPKCKAKIKSQWYLEKRGEKPVPCYQCTQCYGDNWNLERDLEEKEGRFKCGCGNNKFFIINEGEKPID